MTLVEILERLLELIDAKIAASEAGSSSDDGLWELNNANALQRKLLSDIRAALEERSDV